MQKLGCFSQNCVFSGISIDRGYFSINQNWFKIFDWASFCFDRSNLRFRSIKNQVGRFLKPVFQMGQTLFQKAFYLFSLRTTWSRQIFIFLSFSICLFARFSSLQVDVSISPFFLHFISCFHAIHWDFWNFSNWGFWWFKPLFLKLIIGFCSYNVINMIYDV